MRAVAPLMHLGRGVNLAPFSLRYEQIDGADLAGLRARGVEHVRIGGWIATSLQNWTTCPATTMQMPQDKQVAIDHILAGEKAAPDPAARRTFWRLWLITKAAVDVGLKVVLNPFHQRMLVDVSNETVQWVWSAVLREFTMEQFPIDRVAFEMVNEPANWTHARVAGKDWAAIVNDWVCQVRREQPDRMLVITGVQGMRRGQGPSVSSREGLLMDLRAGHLVSPACNSRCMVTFHYYEPRWFTTQSWPTHNGSTPTMMDWSDSPANLDLLAGHFSSVVNATPPGVGVYLGEFGLATSRVNVSQGNRWLAAVQQAALRAGLVGYSVWTYYGTQNGLVPEAEGSTTSQRLCSWDQSPFVSAALGLTHDWELRNETGGVSADDPCEGVRPDVNVSISEVSHVCAADGDRRPQWANGLLVQARRGPVAMLVSTAMSIDVIGAAFLLGATLYCIHLRWCGGMAASGRSGANRNRLVAVRQTVQYSTNAPPPTASPPQGQDGLPACVAPPPSPGQPLEMKPMADSLMPPGQAQSDAVMHVTSTASASVGLSRGSSLRWLSSLTAKKGTVESSNCTRTTGMHGKIGS